MNILSTQQQAQQSKASRKPVPTDGFARPINYVRLSVTDRCDFRCVYCMAETMTFVPRNQLLSLEEMLDVAKALVDLGINRIRLTGGEPLVRKNVLWLIEQINRIEGIEETTLTTNGSQLDQYAIPLRDAGVSRLNISIDSLNADRFRSITRTGDLHKVLAGIDAAKNAGFKKVKLNSVILKNRNDDEVNALTGFAVDNGLDISFIEEMPLGDIVEHDRKLAFFSSDEVRKTISSAFTLIPSDKKTNGPSRYMKVADSETHVGFISPHSNNFCASCNRIRITAEGRLLLCLGNEDSLDLKTLIREQHADQAMLQHAIVQALSLKPEKHHFDLSNDTDIVRFMNMTGG